MSGLPLKADIRQLKRHVRYVPKADIRFRPITRGESVVFAGPLYDGMLILPALSLRTASSTSPIRSQKASATARKLGCITLSCW